MRRKTKRSCAAVLSIIFLAMSVFTADPNQCLAAEPETKDNKIVYYDFKDYSSTIINDASGNGKAAVMRNYDAGGFEIVDANIYGKEVKALSLPGGDNGGYLEFPEGILNGLTNATISMWVNLSTDSGYQRIWDFGNNTTSYMYLLSDGGNDGFIGYSAAVTTQGWSKESGVSKGSNFDKNRWVLTTVVMEGTTMTLYENGTKIGSKDTGISISNLGSTKKNWIGYGQFGDAPTKGMFAEVSIYNYAMTEAQAAGLYEVNDAGIVGGDYAVLDLGNLSSVTGDIQLPVVGANGSTISWTNDCSAITIDSNVAKVTRPAAGEANATGQLAATISYGSESKQKVFPVTVLANNSDKNMVEHDIAAISFTDLNAVISNLTLPTKGEWGSSITWTSSLETTIATDGMVTRPDIGTGNVDVELTATAAFGSEKATKTFTATVIAKKAQVTIVDYEKISVNTTINHSPLLPNFVKVTYSDGTQAKLKTIWPTIIDSSQYTKVGTFLVSGSIVGESKVIEATVNVVEEKEADAVLLAEDFDLSDISLDGSSILTENRERTIAYLTLLDNKRMLYNFYRTFGQTDKMNGVAPIGGWDEPTGLLRGHSTGHYMSALAMAYASTGDPELKTKLDDMVHELRVLQQMSSGDPAAFVTKGTDQAVWSTDPATWGEGFISAYSPDQFALLEQYTPYATIWAPYYTLHKIISGFLDAYEYTGNPEALEAAKGMGKWAYKRLSACTPEQRSKMWDMYIAGEFGGFNQAMARLYNFTGDEDFLNGAKLFDNTKFFNNLTNNIDDIQERHANQHIPQIIGALEIYGATAKKETADSYYYNVAKNFWNMVVSRYAYSIGGVGRGEKFKEPYQLANNIESESNCETCAAYNMLKLTKMLYQYDPDNAQYMDYYERTLYNQIIASQNPNVTSNMHNGTTYMLPIGPGSNKSYGGDYDSFTCCHGTGMENHVKYQEAAYNKSGNTLYVNLYIPTTVTWEEKGIQVKQETTFPSEHTQLTISALDGKTAQDITMKFRVPYWATNGFTIKLNGTVVKENPEVSTYIEVTGMKAGDVITIDMPFTYHLDKTPDLLSTSTVASVMYGPFVMVMKDDSTKWKTLYLSDVLEESIKKVETESVPTLIINNMTFKPMYDASNYAYHTYFKIFIGEDDGKPMYDVTVINRTPKFGTISVSSEVVKEGGNIIINANPNPGYKIKNLTTGGYPLTPNPDKVLFIENIKSNIEIVVTFCLINPPIPDPACLDQTAFPSAHYTASWETVEGINNTAFEPTVSDGGTRKGWGDWPQDAGSSAWVMYEWDTPVTMDQFQIFWYDDGGDTARPATINFDYMDEAGVWKPVTMLSAYADITAIDKYNTIKIEPVTGIAVRINMTIAEGKAATGIYRWKVSGPSTDIQRVPDPIIITNPVDTTTVANNGIVSVAIASVSGSAIASVSGSAITSVSGSAISASSVTGSAIYFTTDGTDPDSNATLYSGEFTISTNQKAGETIIIKAIEVREEWMNSYIVQKSITFLPAQTKPPIPPEPPIPPAPIPTATPTPTPPPIVEKVPKGDHNASASLAYRINNTVMNITVQLDKEEVQKFINEAASDQDIIIPIITQNLINQMKNNGITKLNIGVIIANDLIANSNLDHANINLPAELLKTAKVAGIDINVSAKDETGRELYTWSFGAKSLAGAEGELTDINLSLFVGKVTDHAALSKLLSKEEDTKNGLTLRMLYKGNLPALTCVKIYVGNLVELRNKVIYIYHYNSETDKLETLPFSFHNNIDSEGYITLNLLQCSDYVILTNDADQKIVTSLLEQVKVSPTEQTLYIGGMKDYEDYIKVTVPPTLKVVSSFRSSASDSAIGEVNITYKSGNDKVAVVDKDGKVTVVGVGKTSIFTTITLYNNKTATIATKITVKEPYIELRSSTSAMKVGESFTFKAEAFGLDADKIEWKTTKKSIVVIDKNGKAYAKSKGTDYVKVKIGNVSVKIKVVVR